jgi:prevent-host-death family protein
MRTLTSKDTNYGFGRLIDLARAEPVVVAKHGRPVVVVIAIEESSDSRPWTTLGHHLARSAGQAHDCIAGEEPLVGNG